MKLFDQIVHSFTEPSTPEENQEQTWIDALPALFFTSFLALLFAIVVI
jgi:hypothetical protein